MLQNIIEQLLPVSLVTDKNHIFGHHIVVDLVMDKSSRQLLSALNGLMFAIS